MKETINVVFVGLGGRGRGLLNMVLDTMPDVNVVGVCDLYEDRTEAGKQDVINKRGNTPVATLDYHELLKMEEVDAVITPSAWDAHIPICIDAMNAGKYVATEVGGAYSVDQCWELVKTYERTGVPCMMLENCCYGREELTVLNMIKKGLFGEIIHCEGGYEHDLRDEVALGHVNRHYRLDNYMNRNGELYPTHELGPIAKYLNINRGNRMISLTAMSSKARGLNAWINDNRGADFENANFAFAQGDIVITCIKCAHGETIVLKHDTTLPRAYSRGNLVHGTKGIWSEDKYGCMFDGSCEGASWGHRFTDMNTFFPEHEHPLWKDYTAVGGHGGIDYLVMRGFVEAVKAGTQTPIDVYDTASWMVISCLSEDSIAMGSMPVAIPDFTNGKWIKREPYVRSKYCLEEVCEDLF
ncbi:MAG: gfo/Idh/MocA family oxidoreductase [Ruminococcaceae bacterium]|nr:gfo/Idh/MocA family oxidoreductase [Oscillospiraceae bacterium]